MAAPDSSSASSTRGSRRSADASQAAKGLRLARRFTQPGTPAFDTVEWELRTATITDDKGTVLFEQKDVEVPSGFSQLATNVVVSKYFRGAVGKPGRESSVRQLVGRVVDTITAWGEAGGYFAAGEDRDTFREELAHLLLHQKMAFNSPVWFNVGVEEKPQCSACFINSVEDSMSSIMDLAKTEGMLFKWGSGTGTNLSPLRSSREMLSTGGVASGPVSFMRGFDAFAGVIKSGGKTRRAAKMVILDIDHPDIVDFIQCKVNEERKAWALIEAGYDGSFQGEAYSSVFFQNSNNSVRVTDDFMRAVVEDREWQTKAIVDGRPVDNHRARDLMRMISEAAWQCGDPGMQYDTTINDWHTCKATDRIYASNPCSEYMFLNDTACNLASLNLLKFRDEQGEFDVEGFAHAVDTTILAQEILVDNASYPRPIIARNSHDYRPLGLGYANLGALLMSRGLAYDSEEGRDYSAAITSLMCGEAYRMSAEIAAQMGPFAGYAKNRDAMLGVIQKHRAAANAINAHRVPESLYAAARDCWNQAYAAGVDYGYKNSQVTVLAPTGTIAFMMDCDTTGIEPDIALIKYKKLVGGGFLKIVNRTVPEALKRLGYAAKQIEEIVAYVDDKETIEGAPHLKAEHLPIFDCAFKPQNGKRSIQYMGHVRMMAACQPFLSGAISKTVNMPEECTVEDISDAYIESWKLGLKAIAIYRDGSKKTQPLNTGRTKSDDGVRRSTAAAEPARPQRRRLPDERQAITHKFSIAGHEGYITVGLYEDHTPGEIFVRMAKEGSAISGLMDSFATATSIMLQYGVPLEVLVNKFSNSRFEPSGFTTNPDIPMAKSIMDYIFRFLAIKFMGEKGAVERAAELSARDADPTTVAAAVVEQPTPAKKGKANGAKGRTLGLEDLARMTSSDAPPCSECGSVTVPNGACYRCINCGATTGCS